jgi:hypothetical protein
MPALAPELLFECLISKKSPRARLSVVLVSLTSVVPVTSTVGPLQRRPCRG